MITKKPHIFLIFILILFSFWLFSSNQSQAVYTGNDTYTDPNNTIYLQYNSIVNDFVWRLDYFKEHHAIQYDTLITYLERMDLGYYIYYGSFDGTDMLNGLGYTQDIMYIIFYDLGSPSFSTSLYENYCGMDCNIKTLNNVYVYFELSDDLYFTDYTSQHVQFPSCLYNFKVDVLTNYLKGSSYTQGIDEIVSSVDNIENTITSRDDNQAESEINDAYLDISYATDDQDTNSQDAFLFISSFWSTVTSHIGTDDVISLTINLPFVTGGITFRSDMLYNIIKNTLIYTLLQLAYYYVFGMYIVMGTWRMLCWFQQGEFTKTRHLPIDNVMNHMLM